MFEIIGWIRIVLSPLLVFSAIGAILYYNFPSLFTYVFALLLGALGLVIGVLWANRIWKKYGTMQFLSRVNASPDLDKKIDEEKK